MKTGVSGRRRHRAGLRQAVDREFVREGDGVARCVGDEVDLVAALEHRAQGAGAIPANMMVDAGVCNS